MDDLRIENGLVFDGSGKPGVVRDLAIRKGVVVEAVPGTPAKQMIDARGKWVMPGFIDMHTHYDAELIASPGLTESVRHGVTTVAVGSCSISTILASADDCSDLFTRVEAVPREHVLPLLRAEKTWDTPAGYVKFLRDHPLGANVVAFLGHSDIRARVLGLERAVDGKVRPTVAELEQMSTWLEQGLDAGLLGLSTMTTPWDKLDGDRFRSRSLPSTYATWHEYRYLNRVLRRRGRILQSAPNIVTPANALLFFLASIPTLAGKKLKTTLITLADAKAKPGLHRVIAAATRVVNRVLRGDVRWQTLPVPFELYADGIDLVVFEEFGAGQAALHLADEVARNALMSDEAYRRKFRRDYERRWTPRVWHRDFHDAHIVACPDAALVGTTFGAIADAKHIHPVDAFLDLVVQYGTKIRWRMTIANHRPKEIARMVKEPAALLGFADSGAHIRNMAFYNAPLRMLKLVRDAELAGAPVMPIEKAVWRLTGEIADWLNVDAGSLGIGRRADVVIVDPVGLDDGLATYHEAPMAGFGDLVRMVNRSDRAVAGVVVNGRVAYHGNAFVPAFGKERGFGQFLPAIA